jgi:hypothetical protein
MAAAPETMLDPEDVPWHLASEIQFAQGMLYARSGYTPELAAWLRANAVDLRAVHRYGGILGMCRVAWQPGERFDFFDRGEPALVLEVLDRDSETCLDLIAWPADATGPVATLGGRAGLLGLNAAVNPATYVGNRALDVHRSPLEWLQADCAGAVLIHPVIGAPRLAEACGSIMARDLDHGRELARHMGALFPQERILVPASSIRRGAA